MYLGGCWIRMIDRIIWVELEIEYARPFPNY